MNFEQFCEEVRMAYPNAGVISATEEPLALVVDGVPVDPSGLLAAHQPCRLRLDQPAIRADGEDTAVLSVEFPGRANLSAGLTLRHGETVVAESLDLDAQGRGTLEIVSSTPGEIRIEVSGKPVRISLKVEEIL